MNLTKQQRRNIKIAIPAFVVIVVMLGWLSQTMSRSGFTLVLLILIGVGTLLEAIGNRRHGSG